MQKFGRQNLKSLCRRKQNHRDNLARKSSPRKCVKIFGGENVKNRHCVVQQYTVGSLGASAWGPAWRPRRCTPSTPTTLSALSSCLRHTIARHHNDKLTMMTIEMELHSTTTNTVGALHCYAPAHSKEEISDAFVRLSVCPSVAYIANNSTTQRPSVPTFGRKVPHLRCDSHTSYKVKRSKIRVRGGRGHTVSAEPGGHTACYTNNT